MTKAFRKYNLRKVTESSSRAILLLSAMISIIAVFLIIVFILGQALPTLKQVRLKEFFFSTVWYPTKNPPHYGVASFIIASFEVTFIALILAIPVSLSATIYLSQFAKNKLAKILKTSIELLAGIPSIIYGLFGLSAVVPFVRNVFGGNGMSLLSAGIILAIMILPTIINLSEVALSAVSQDLINSSIAMGATRWQTISRIILPAASSGIISSIVLGLGRAIGETTAVLLVGGNAPVFAKKPIDMGRTLTMNIITDMAYATDTHRSALFMTGALLLLVILILNLCVVKISKSKRLEG